MTTPIHPQTRERLPELMRLENGETVRTPEVTCLTSICKPRDIKERRQKP